MVMLYIYRCVMWRCVYGMRLCVNDTVMWRCVMCSGHDMRLCVNNTVMWRVFVRVDVQKNSPPQKLLGE